MIKLVPTILTGSEEEFFSKLDKLEFCDWIQVDFMDGKFVPSKSVDISKVPSFKSSKKKWEAHLMVEDPESYITILKNKGFEKIIFHFESVPKDKIRSLTKKIMFEGLESVLAINPETSIDDIKEFRGLFATILFLGVNPGKEGQEFQEHIIDKIKELKSLDDKILVQVDGGVNKEVAKKLKGLVDIVNSGSYISSSDEPLKRYKELLDVLK